MALSRFKHIVLLAAGLTVAVVLLTAMDRRDQPLWTAAASCGIVSLELAGTPSVVDAILASWGSAGRRQARLSLRLDYLFLISYALVLWMPCRTDGIHRGSFNDALTYQ